MRRRRAGETGIRWLDSAESYESAVLLDQLVDGLAKLGGQGFRIAEVVTAGLDGRAEDEFERRTVGRWIEMARVNGEQLANADEGDWDERDLGTNGEKCGSVEECLQIAVGSAPAFRKDKDVEAVAQGADSGGEAGQGGSRVLGVDGNLAGAVEVPADEWEAPELFLGQDAELEGQAGEDDRCVHVGGVVGGEDGGFGGDVFEADDLKAGAGEEYGRAGPNAGDAVLQAAVLVKKRGGEGQADEDHCAEEEWRGEKDVAALTVEKRKRFWSHGIGSWLPS